MNKIFITVFAFHCFGLYANAQKTIQYNLAELLNKNQLQTDSSNHAKELKDVSHNNCSEGDSVKVYVNH